jgi:enamine deaminase RidA (YjgF/YER057c/UK114 family)
LNFSVAFLSRQCNNLLWLAGQIGLDAGSMTLVPDALDQIRLAFRHCAQVLHATRSKMDQTLSGVVFWNEAFWHEQQVRIRTELMPLCDDEFQPSSGSSSSSKSAHRKKLIHVVVPRLPRDALVEVQLIAQPTTTALPMRAHQPSPFVAAGSTCSAHAIHSTKMLASHWCTLTVDGHDPDAVRSTSDLLAAMRLLVESTLQSLTAAKLR